MPFPYLIESFTPSGAAVSASPAPGPFTANNLTDVTGNVWSTDGAGNLLSNVSNATPYSNGLLLFPTTDDAADYNSRYVPTFTPRTGGSVFYVLSRLINSGSASTFYLIGVVPGTTPAAGYIIIIPVVNGVAVTQYKSANGINLSLLTEYMATADVVQTNSTTTTITVNLYTRSGGIGGTPLFTYSNADTTAALQNITGQNGICSSNSGAGAQTTFQNLSLYADALPAAATGYSVTGIPSTASAGTTYTGTITLTGPGKYQAAPIVITVTDANGTFIGDPVTIPIGLTTGTFQWTPNTATSHTLSFSHTGGNSGMSDQANITSNASVASATGYSASFAAAVGVSGSPVQLNLALTGGSTLTSTLIVTPSDGAGGTFSPSTVSIVNGATTGNCQYTPSSVGNKSISFSHIGGNAGMSDAVNASFISGTLLTAANAAVTQSPNTWTVNASKSGALQSWNSSAYIRFPVQGATAYYLLFDPASPAFGSWQYKVDLGGTLGGIAAPSPGTIPSLFFGNPSGNMLAINTPDTGLHEIIFYVSSVPVITAGEGSVGDRTAFIGIQGLILPPGAMAGSSTKRPRVLCLPGDSIPWGALSLNAIGGSGLFSYIHYVGEAFLRQGFEYFCPAAPSQGILTNTPSPSNWSNAQNTLGKIDNTYNWNVAPDLVLDEQVGGNDYLGGAYTTAQIQTALVTFWTTWRTKYPQHVHVILSTFNGVNRAGILAAFDTYQAATYDPLTTLFDPQTDAHCSMGPGPPLTGFQTLPIGDWIANVSNNQVHLWYYGHGQIGDIILNAGVTAYQIANQRRRCYRA